jgi:hypothetical protein
MTVSVGLMRAYGGSLGKRTLLPFAYSVCTFSSRVLYWERGRWREEKLLIGTVTHGLMSRVFLMKWYHFSVEYFEDLRNVNHCEFLIMRKSPDSGKYILENRLRTWSELKRERAAAAKEKEKKLISSVSEKDREKEKRLEATGLATSQNVVPPRKKWGGCPNGCNHAKYYYKKENPMHAMELNSKPSPLSTTATTPSESQSQSQIQISSQSQSLPLRRASTRRWANSSAEEDEDEEEAEPEAAPHRPTNVTLPPPSSLVSSPAGTPSFISVEERLLNHIKSPKNSLLLTAGRDFGGSASGYTSQAGSDTEFSADEDVRRREQAPGIETVMGECDGGEGERKMLLEKAERESGMGRGAMADALGDREEVVSGTAAAESDVEKEEKSIMGSVY